MARCWTCGTLSSDGPRFSCSTCIQLKSLREIRDTVHAASTGAAGRLDVIADLHRQMYGELLQKLDSLHQTMEWGFSSVLWAIEQETAVLRSIDATLKTPRQTQANELRVIGESLRLRGDIEQAEEHLEHALQLNPLDYRSYLGLAYVRIEQSRFDDADRVLEASFRHAPRTSFDYRSLTHRLRGRLKFCTEHYTAAVEELRNAVTLEPTYAKALYELAQYYACIGAEDNCLRYLRDVIALESDYWYAARSEPLFGTLRLQVEEVLRSILAAPLLQAEQERKEARQALVTAQASAHEYNLLRNLKELEKHSTEGRLLRKAVEEVRTAEAQFDPEDYNASLAAARHASAARSSASAAVDALDNRVRRFRDTQAKALAEKLAKERDNRRSIQMLIGSALAWLLLWGVGAILTGSDFLEGVLAGIQLSIVLAIFIAIGSCS